MGLQIIRYKQNQAAPRWGVMVADQIQPLNDNYTDLADFLQRGQAGALLLASQRSSQSGTAIAPSSVQILSPLTQPCRLLCQGLNYTDHRTESGHRPDGGQNLFFRKDESSLSGPRDAVLIPPGCQLFDYEIELGLVIGKPITEPTVITDVQLPRFVAGWVIMNDYSARDLMFRATFRQWYKGKSYRTTCPSGPYLFLPDAADWQRLYDLRLTLTVNGQVRQEANVGQLIYKPAESLTEASQFVDLAVGDCLLTGTPGGVAISAPSKLKQLLGALLFDEQKQVDLLTRSQLKTGRFLKSGDVVECHIRTPDKSIDLGIMRNQIKAINEQ